MTELFTIVTKKTPKREKKPQPKTQPINILE